MSHNIIIYLNWARCSISIFELANWFSHSPPFTWRDWLINQCIFKFR